MTSLSGNLLAQANPALEQTNFSTDVDALEILNGKRFEIIRTPTQPELTQYAEEGTLNNYDMNTRTMDEQEAMQNGEFLLGYGHEGQVDDWFTLLNLGYRFTALGNLIPTEPPKPNPAVQETMSVSPKTILYWQVMPPSLSR